ncbi:unnamed protein product [Sphacelaria rigidula]
MEALRACERALAEAAPPPAQSSPSGSLAIAKEIASQCHHHVYGNPCAIHCRVTAETPHARVRGGLCSQLFQYMCTTYEFQAAAALPLCESLPLLRRAARLAVPPLRWRKRPPPDLREARLTVLRLDLSWRQRNTVSIKQTPGGGGGRRPGRGRGGDGGRSSSRAAAVGLVQSEGGSREEDEGVEGGGSSDAGGIEGVDTAEKVAGVIAHGTSLEDAVLESVLKDLGAEWAGLHAENSICLGLFALLCWDALFLPQVRAAPSAGGSDDSNTTYCPFRSPFQSEPADLMTTAFAGRRCGVLEGKSFNYMRGFVALFDKSLFHFFFLHGILDVCDCILYTCFCHTISNCSAGRRLIK